MLKKISDFKKLKNLLDKNAARYETPDFIPADPISIPHRFSKKEDIEIAGFFVSIFAWGNRTAILKSADKLMTLMQNEPYAFLMNADSIQLKQLKTFYHRTLNGEDTFAIAKAVRHCYMQGSFEKLFAPQHEGEELIRGMPERTVKHIGNMENGSAAKRLNMFLRWMVRPSTAGVDFGLWQTVSPAELYLPLDVHCARRGRELGLLIRKQNDRKAVEEITARLREFCPNDPVKYDFALFAPAVQ